MLVRDELQARQETIEREKAKAIGKVETRYQRESREIEDQIQLSRRYYNGAARDLNIAVESFPSNLIAGRFGFTKAEFLELESAAERAVPVVSF